MPANWRAEVKIGWCSSIVIVPLSGAMSPAIAANSVDLPQPFGPTITVIEPAGICYSNH
ncbi:MAG: hypothetical protein RLZZ193_253 [Actinomycetota bacterium]